MKPSYLNLCRPVRGWEGKKTGRLSRVCCGDNADAGGAM